MPTTRNNSNSKTAKAKDAIALLKQDHEKVRELLSRLEETSGRGAKSRTKLLEEVAREVRVHSQIEEEIFYPAFREAAESEEEEKLFFEATEEHHVVDLVLPELEDEDPASITFAAKAKVLKDLIEHHADEEEKEMFPAARKLLGRELLLELGEQLEQRKQELLEEYEG
jgi:hemerythrin-like domain-containing protein